MQHKDLDLALLNPWQRDFPLQREPFAVIGQRLGLDVAQVLEHYTRLQRQGSLSRIGAVFAPGAGGASLLAAMAVPPDRLNAVAAVVSSPPGVYHNYEREHTTNLWFVATGRDAAQVEQLLRSIEAETDLPVLRLPMLRPYRIDTGFDLRASQSRASGATHWAQTPLQAHDKPLAALAEQGDPGRYRFPRPMTDRPGLDFSFSGLKTFALNTWREEQAARPDREQARADIARAFEEAER